MTYKKKLVMIPTYNERDNVPKMCKELSEIGLSTDVLFVDDNSPDGTGQLLDELSRQVPRVHVLHRSGKLGVGSAHIEGIRWAYLNNYSILITMDCDFTHSPSNISDLLNQSDRYDIVVGSRFILDKSLNGWSLWRKFLTVTGHRLTSTLLGLPYDATGAFRLYNLDTIPFEVFEVISSKGYSFFFESLAILNLNKLSIGEIPIILPPRTYGHSKLRFSDMVQSLIFMLKLSFNIQYNKDNYLIEQRK